jgi:hypothetical protein
MFSVLTLLDILDSCVREAMSLYNKSTDDRAQSIPRADIDAAVALAPAAHARPSRIRRSLRWSRRTRWRDRAVHVPADDLRRHTDHAGAAELRSAPGRGSGGACASCQGRPDGAERSGREQLDLIHEVVNSERTAIIVRLEAMRDEILDLAAAWRSWSRWACWCRKAASATVSSQRSPGRARWPNASRWKPLRLSSPQFMKRMSRLGASHPAQSRRLRRSRDKTHVGRKLKHCQPLIARPKYARRFSHPLELLLDISLDPRAAMSPYRFLRTFRMVVGLTPHSSMCTRG